MPFISHPSRKNIRLDPSIYRQSHFLFLTLCTHNKSHLFGFIENGILHPTEIGNIARSQIERFSWRYPHIHIHASVLMPNHMHLLVEWTAHTRVVSPSPGQFVNLLKGAVSHACGKSIWQRGYYDHVIRDEADGLRILEYMENNPRKWELDKEYTVE